jgi:NTE family protein
MLHPRIAVVLGGGGLKGFAHIGALRALRERGIRPAIYAGSSIGALIGVAAAAGLGVDEMADRARRLRRRDLFRINPMSVLIDRMRTPSLYAGEPLRALCEQVLPDVSFQALPVPALVNTVDLVRGTSLVWGLPGLDDASVRDAVYASCALPGFFPPGRVNDRLCVDGGTIDNLPASVAPFGMPDAHLDAIVAVDVGNADLTHAADIGEQGFASIFMRAASVMMHALQDGPLATWGTPPMLLVRPRVNQWGWFTFEHTRQIIDEGYRAASAALASLDELLEARRGIFPRRDVRVEVEPARCIGCGTCVALAPTLMRLDAQRKAYAEVNSVSWSPADGEFVRHCPTGAITVKPAA